MSGYINRGDNMILIRAKIRGTSGTCGDIVIYCAVWLRTQQGRFLDSAWFSLVYKFFPCEIRYLPHLCYSTARGIWLGLRTERMFLDFPWQKLIVFFLRNFFSLSLSPRLSLWVNTEDPQFINLFLLVHCFKMRLLIESKDLIRVLLSLIMKLLCPWLTGSNLFSSLPLIRAVPCTVGA